jgi:Ca-activated chloride channel homolog
MSTVRLGLHPERRAIASGARTSIRVAFTLAAEGSPVEAERAPIACALLLDVSGSMSGPPLECLVQSVEKLCELAQPPDQLAMVVFSESASVVSPLTEMDAAGRRLFATRARRLDADGGTNIEDALKKGASVVRSAPPGARQSLLLLSDGQPNRGVADPADLARIVVGLRPHIAVSSLGYGVKHSEDVLSAIADAGAGRFQFITNPASCRRDLAVALGSQGDIVAGSIELCISPADGVEIRRFVGDPPIRYAKGGAIVSFSDMEDRSQRMLAVELEISDGLPSGGKLLDVRLAYRDALGGAEHATNETISVDLQSSEGPIDHDSARIILLVRAEEARKQARALADRGQFDGAATILRTLLADIEATPGYVASDGSPLSEAHELLLDEAVAYERNPSPESYGVFRKHTIALKLNEDASHSVMPVRGSVSRRFSQITGGLSKRAHLIVLQGLEAGRIHRIGDSCAIGRTAGADFVVNSQSVSRRHAEIYALENDHWICDLGSTNTTAVNGNRITTIPHKLADGDIIRLGDIQIRYVLGDPP